jgi:hypothetical protein
MNDKVKTWRQRLAEAKIDLPVRDGEVFGVLDKENRTIIRHVPPDAAPFVVEAMNDMQLFDKIKQYIRAGDVSSLFPPQYYDVDKNTPEAEMFDILDKHLRSLPDLE